MGQMNREMNLTRSIGNELPMNVHVVASEARIAQLEAEMGDDHRLDLKTWTIANDAPVPPEILKTAAILVLEIDPANDDSLARIQQVRNARRSLPLIAALEDANLKLVRTLVREGVSDVVTLPFDIDDLSAQILRASADVVETSGDAALAPMITAVSALGGLGASSVLAHLAFAISRDSRCGGRTCVIDLDMQFGDIAAMYGTESTIDILDLLEAGDRLDGDLLRDAAIRTDAGIHLISAPDGITPLETVDVDNLLKLLALARTEYDFVLVDLPANWTNWTLSAALACSEILLIADQSISGIRQSKRVLGLFDEMQVPRQSVRIVVNRVEKKLFKSISVQDVANALGRDVFATIARDKSELALAQEQGALLSQSNRRAPFVRDIAAIAEDLCERKLGAG